MPRTSDSVQTGTEDRHQSAALPEVRTLRYQKSERIWHLASGIWYLLFMVQAFVLIQTDTGRASDVAREIKELDGVNTAEAVTGPYDVIVSAEAADVDALGHLVVTQIQPVTGIVRTLTCPVIRI